MLSENIDTSKISLVDCFRETILSGNISVYFEPGKVGWCDGAG